MTEVFISFEDSERLHINLVLASRPNGFEWVARSLKRHVVVIAWTPLIGW